MVSVLSAALIAVVGLLLVGCVALVPVGMLVFGAMHLRRRLRGEPERDPDDDPTDAEHVEHAIILGSAGAVGVAVALLSAWHVFPSLRPPGAMACALLPAVLGGAAHGFVVRRIPAAAGFKLTPAVRVGVVVTAVVAGLAVAVASAIG